MDGLEEIKNLARQAETLLLPKKSQASYMKEYEKFLDWMKSKNIEVVNEMLMLAYMMELSVAYKASSLWCIHSKLQTMLRIKNDIDIGAYSKLRAFMKSVNKGYEAKKSYVFTEEQLYKFFVEAPDDTFLFLKVVTICGLFGSCRRYEMHDLRISDIKKEGSILIINIRPSKTETGRTFAVIDDSIPYAKLFNKYLSLRPENVTTDRVFLKYANGKCVRQVVGINTFGACPSRVAKFLKLPNSEKYTGHAFRRTSATVMANGGLSVDELKRQVGWKSSTVATGYIEQSITNKMKVSRVIAEAVNGASTSSVASTSSLVNSNIDVDMNNVNKNQLQAAGINILNNNNCTFNIYMK